MNFMKHHARRLLLGINVLLVVALGLLWVGPGGKLRRTQWQPPAAEKTDYAAMFPDLAPSVAMSTSEVIAMLERPLFTLTRRPPPPPPPPKPAETPPPDNFGTAKLTGVYLGQGEGGIILNIGGKNRRVRMREQIEGWTLSALDQRSATFTNGSSQRVLPLTRGNLTTFTGQAPAPAPAAPVFQPPPPSPVPTLPLAEGPASGAAAAAAAPAPTTSATTPGAARSGRSQPVFGGSIR